LNSFAGENFARMFYNGVMEKEDMARIARWIGLVYAPIALFVLFVFLLVNHYLGKIEEERVVGVSPATTSADRVRE
jgi:hypothetical protein